MAITTPFSLSLGRDEDAIAAVEGSGTDSVPDKMKIFLGENVLASRPQVYVGSLKAVFRHMMNESWKRTANDSSQTGHGHWQAAGAANISIGVSGDVGPDDVAIIVSGTFEVEAATHFYDETFHQLLDGLLERANQN